MGEISYITGSAYAEGGGTLVLQEACIFNEKQKEEIPVIMAAVFSGHSELEHGLAIEIGEWFQNSLVRMINREGADSLINVCIDGLGPGKLVDKINTTEYVCAIFAGDSSVIFKKGSSVGLYCIEDLFGKAVCVPMEPGTNGIMVGTDKGGALWKKTTPEHKRLRLKKGLKLSKNFPSSSW